MHPAPPTTFHSRTRSRQAFIAAAGLVVIASTLCAQSTQRPAAGSQEATNGEIRKQGTTEPVAKVEVPSPIRGILADVNVKEGQAVKKGDQLAKLDDALQISAVKLATLQAEQMSQINAAEAQAEFAKQVWQNSKGKASPGEVQEKEAASKQAGFAVEVERDKQRVAQLKLEQEKITLDHMTLKSPIDGYVLKVQKHVGEQTDEGPVVTVVQTSKLNAVFFLPTKMFGKVKVGDRIPLEFDSGTREGVVVTVDPILEADLFRVKLEVENADAKIAAGVPAVWRMKAN